MIVTSGKESVSSLFFLAFVLSCVFIGYTILHNRDISQRRLEEPVQTVGTLASSHCTTFIRGHRGGGPQPYVALKYKYWTIGPNPTQHVFATTQWFDTLKECAAFEKSNSNVATIWYEKEHPGKASLYETEAYTWGGLYGLIPALLLAIWGMYDQKRINQEKRDFQKANRTSNRLKRERKS